MKINKLNRIKLDEPISVYDVINAEPYHNFLVRCGNDNIVASNCKERMSSRFMVNGKIAGKMFIVSSKKSEYDFLENYIKKQKGKPGVMVCDAKLWEVKPQGSYLGKKFLLAVGGANKPSKIVPDNEVTYKITLDNGDIKEYHFDDVVKLVNGRDKNVQDLKNGDEIVV